MGEFFDVQTAAKDFACQLAEWLRLPEQALTIDPGQPNLDASAMIGTPQSNHIPPTNWLIEARTSGNRAIVARAIDHLQAGQNALSQSGRQAVPLVLVPYMSEGGKQACHEEGVSWADLSGNADITAPGIRILVDGRKNRFTRSGRPRSLFAPKSARVAHYLLLHPGEALSQRQIHEATRVDEGQVSRIVAGLLDLGMIKRLTDNRVQCLEPKRLLAAWRDEARFDQNRIIAGHMSGAAEGRLKRLIQQFGKFEHQSAATGLSAAWLYTQHAMHRLVTVYVREASAIALLPEIGFRQEPRGANTWIVVPKDEGVFLEAHEVDGIPCVDPIQTYIDLKGHPERAAEAAEYLYEHYFAF